MAIGYIAIFIQVHSEIVVFTCVHKKFERVCFWVLLYNYHITVAFNRSFDTDGFWLYKYYEMYTLLTEYCYVVTLYNFLSPFFYLYRINKDHLRNVPDLRNMFTWWYYIICLFYPFKFYDYISETYVSSDCTIIIFMPFNILLTTFFACL